MLLNVPGLTSMAVVVLAERDGGGAEVFGSAFFFFFLGLVEGFLVSRKPSSSRYGDVLCWDCGKSEDLRRSIV